MAAPIRLGYNFVLITATWGLQQRLLYEPLGSGRGAFRHGLDYGSDTAVGDVITVSAPSGGRARPRRARLDRLRAVAPAFCDCVAQDLLHQVDALGHAGRG
ncbi:hypothetical protein FKM82_028687 [Ascaphus truei]